VICDRVIGICTTRGLRKDDLEEENLEAEAR
jgi:hypothetical protein